MSERTKIAVPLQGERVSGHFGHPECFSFVSVDPVSQTVLDEKRMTPPPHEPGRLPIWLSQQGATVVLAGSPVGAEPAEGTVACLAGWVLGQPTLKPSPELVGHVWEAWKPKG